MVAREVDSRRRHQGCQPDDKVERLEHHVRRAIPVRRLQADVITLAHKGFGIGVVKFDIALGDGKVLLAKIGQAILLVSE